MITICSWNINGIRAINKKNEIQQLINKHQDIDILCFQEIKCDESVCSKELMQKYNSIFPYIYFNTSKTKKGYSGTAILSKQKPLHISYDNPLHNENDEGRIITATFANFVLVNVYTPNSGRTLERLEYRTTKWDHYFNEYLKKLQKTHINLIVCGDLNVVNSDLDIYKPSLSKSAGNTKEERISFQNIIKTNNLIDTYRHLHPNDVKYSYWSYIGSNRSTNKGWRIDYVLVSKSMLPNIVNADIMTSVLGSDHAPVFCTLKNIK